MNEHNHKRLDTEVWATVISSGEKYFGRMLISGSLFLCPMSQRAEKVRDWYLCGNPTFEFDLIFEYKVKSEYVDERGLAVSDETVKEALKRGGKPYPIRRTPQFNPYDFTTGPVLIRADVLQIGNLLSETDKKTYELMIARVLEQYALVKANDAGLQVVSSMSSMSSMTDIEKASAGVNFR